MNDKIEFNDISSLSKGQYLIKMHIKGQLTSISFLKQ